jgi:hypothetical protein
MSAATIGDISLFMGLFCFGFISKIWIWPRLKSMTQADALSALLIFSGFRYLGLQFINPAVADLPAGFAQTAAYGDFVVGLIAIAGALAIRFHQGFGVILAWIYAVCGTLDFAYAGKLAAEFQASDHIGAAWPIFHIGGPAWMVTLVLIFVTLIKHKDEAEA